MRRLNVLSLLFVLALGGAARASERPAETSAVCRFTVPGLVDGRYGIEVVLSHRGGEFHNGYALVPERDSLVHSVDVTPSRPIQWQTAGGQPLDVPESMRGYYSYTRKEEFAQWKGRYEKGEITIGYPIPTPPIAWDGRRLTGTVDVLVSGLDVANQPGRDGTEVPWRIRVGAEGAAGSRLTGTWTAWTYAEKDDRYGEDHPKQRGDLANARWDAEYWTPAPGSEYAPGRDWPQARGPALTGAAADCGRPLVENLHDARLLWASEEILPGGRGAVLSRGGFAMYPYAWQNIGFGGFSGPAVAGGKVYQFLSIADESLIAADPEVAKNVYVRLGADARFLGNERGCMRDSVLCLDAQTGRTLWWWRSEKTFGNVPEGKGGIGTTACVNGGRVYARGSGGLYCLDASDGRLLWQSAGVKKGDLRVGYGLSGSWSHDMSPVLIGGVLVMTHGKDDALAGIDPASGDLLWTHDHVAGVNQVPTKVVLEGKEYVIVAADQQPRLVLIQPADGRIIWTSDTLGANKASLSVWGNIVCGNAAPAGQEKRRAAAVRVSLRGAQRLWESDQAGYPPFRSVPVAHKGYFYVDDREHFWCLEAATGRIVNRQPHIYRMTGGSHNWVWTIAGNDRIVTSGLLTFSTGDEGFERLPGRLSLPLADGYMCPIKPALADGRLVVRLGDKLVCYDLRRDPAREVVRIDLTCRGAFAGSVEPGDPVRIRLRAVDGQVAEAATNWPEVLGPEAAQVNDWIAGYGRPLPWPSSPAPDLRLTEAGLAGEVRLAMGWSREDWRLDLKRQDGTFAGTFVRSLPPLASPVRVSGKVEGRTLDLGGETGYVLDLADAASQFRRDPALRGITIVLVPRESGLRAWACSGRLNGIAHEVDASGLVIKGGHLRGKVTVIFRDDTHFHLNAETATSVAATYEVDAAVAEGKVRGTHTGALGVAWSREGRAEGTLAR